MKNQACKGVLIAALSLAFGSGLAFCADNTPPAEATPGTAAAQDTKTQQNDPTGPNHQKTASMPANTKDVHNVPAGPAANGMDQSASPASKKPQENQPPSTSNP